MFKKDEAATFESNEDDKAGAQDISNQDESYYWKLREEDVKDPSTGWALKKEWPEKNGVKVTQYQKKMPDTKMNMMYSESIYKGVKPATFLDFIRNLEKNPEHLKHHKKWIVLERDESGYPCLVYTLNKMPMMTDREGIVRFTGRTLDDGSHLIISKSEEHKDYPRGNHAIRTQVFKGTVFFEKDGDLFIHEYA